MGAVAASFGLPPGDWETIWTFLEAHLPDVNARPTLVGTTGGNHVPGSFHYRGQALDRGDADNGGRAGCTAIYNLCKPFADHPGAPIIELFYNPAGTGWKYGKPIGPVVNHNDHVHIAIAAGATLPIPDAPPPKRKKSAVATIVTAKTGPHSGKNVAVLENGNEVEIDKDSAKLAIDTGASWLVLDSTINPNSKQSQFSQALNIIKP